ncbi:hypothetical protein DRO64_01115 [Candidatus Bathyarchaeota archaeon]|nr:MAG: hypothetical protein DRO64_01115 [Candidatus Bathyarchaeota archaeon]HDM88617.1 hypothetical protein [Candidatus Bathyarchaeota archaeon]
MHDIKRLFKRSDFPFVLEYQSLKDVLIDHDLAALGDAFVNFIYSLALSFRRGKPVGEKLDNETLASALREAGLRKILPFRMDRHEMANAAEALIVYAWLRGVMSMGDILRIIERSDDIRTSWSVLLRKIVEEIRLLWA